jgi:hypothetical protein
MVKPQWLPLQPPNHQSPITDHCPLPYTSILHLQDELIVNQLYMPRGASPKREREYKQIEKKFEKEGRYQGREKEVAARIVNKQRAKAGETEKSSSNKRKTLRTKR